MKILYFVHDLNHADIARRVELLKSGGAHVVLAGFHRKRDVDPAIADEVIPLGQTRDGAFLQRIAQVARAALKLGRVGGIAKACDAVVARNLEMFVLASVARRRFHKGEPLTYECLDIHRLMIGEGVVGRLLRALEKHLLKSCQTLVTSSPGFIKEHFARRYPVLPKVILIENKVFPALAGGRADPPLLAPGPPWRIGWYGVIRCRKSLEILSSVAAAAPGLVEVIVSGRPAAAVFGDVDAAFSKVAGVSYVGGFADEDALAALFRSVHFAWAMDFYEAGANSDWLLPNRLYRSVYYGAAPIALASVETGRWLNSRDIGLVLDAATPEALRAAMETVTPASMDGLRSALKRVQTSDLVTLPTECRNIVSALGAGRAA